MAGVKTTPLKKVSYSSAASLCRVCGSQVYVNGGFYSLVAGKLKEANIVERIAELFGPHILCKECFRRIERYEATL